MTQTRLRALVAIAALSAAFAAPAGGRGEAGARVNAARQVPFIAGGGGAGGLFDPEIDVVESGALNDVQATVSHDRKYVTLNMRPTLSSLQALRTFAFQTNATALPPGINGGLVGGVGDLPVVAPAPAPAPAPKDDAARGDRSAVRGRAARAFQARRGVARDEGRVEPAQPRPAPPAPSILNRAGMTRVAPLSD